MKKITFSFLLVFLSFLVFAQADLNTSLQSLQGQLTEVETKSAIFTQVLEWTKDNPTKITLTINETSKKKGKEKVI